MILEKLQPTSEKEWDSYIASHPQATCYHHRAWRTAAESVYHIPTSFLMARDEKSGILQGVLPLFQVRGLIRPHLTNGLFGAYAPILASNDTARRALLEKSFEVFLNERFSFFLLKTLEESNTAYSTYYPNQAAKWVIATLPLQNNPDLMWKSLRDKIRNCVRKAAKSGLKPKWGHDQLEPFYAVLSENMHSKGAPIYGSEFLREILDKFGTSAQIITLWHKNRAVAGALILEYQKTLYVPFASSLPTSLNMSPNNLLYWEIIRYGSQAQFKTLDFGRSLINSGSLAFKLGWGAQTRAQPCYVWSRSNQKLDLDPNQNSIHFFVRQWKRVPRAFANAVGPWICKQVAGLL